MVDDEFRSTLNLDVQNSSAKGQVKLNADKHACQACQVSQTPG